MIASAPGYDRCAEGALNVVASRPRLLLNAVPILPTFQIIDDALWS